MFCFGESMLGVAAPAQGSPVTATGTLGSLPASGCCVRLERLIAYIV